LPHKLWLENRWLTKSGFRYGRVKTDPVVIKNWGTPYRNIKSHRCRVYLFKSTRNNEETKNFRVVTPFQLKTALPN